MSVPLDISGADVARDKMSKLADYSAIGGVALFGVALADIQAILSIIATALAIVATSITIGIHVSRLWKERRK